MWILSRAKSRRTSVLAIFAVSLAACSEISTTPVDSVDAVVSAAKAGTPTTLIEQFALAQGTYCDADPAGALPCSLLPPDIGYIIGGGVAPDFDPQYTMDVGGVNARYWQRNGLSPSLPAYEASGTVVESRLGDGRRRLVINMKSRNTLSVLFTSIDGSVLGADFHEYPGETPMLADIDASIDVVVPADFVGMPDLAQVVFSPAPGMELRRFAARVEGEGVLRAAFDGIPAGTHVRMSNNSNWMPKLGARGVRSERMIMLDFDPTSRISVKPVR